ncbi:MAG: hypothetical protein MJZ17_11335 [Bacteroidales bacterium]|nr:hypothetical protein [Bacteroidales bacterium]
MIENPYNWYLECGKYAIENKHSMDYGLFFRIEENAPENVKKSYRKYLDICIKPFISMGLHMIEDNHIVDFVRTDNPIEQEQIELFQYLVDIGYIDNSVFLPKVITGDKPSE